MKREILCIENGGVEDLHHIFLQLKCGEVTGLAFEKVKEQNSFLKIVTGEKPMKEGRLYFHEKLLRDAEGQKQLRENTTIITNVSNIVPSISVIENLFLMDGRVKGQLVRKRSYFKRGRQVLEELNYTLDLRKRVSELDLCERLSLEMIKSYIMKKEIIVITNVWGMLEIKDRDKIWNLLECIRQKGIAFLLIDELYDLDFKHLNSLSIVKQNRTLISKDVNMDDYQKMHTIFYGSNLRRRYFQDSLIQNADGAGKNVLELYLLLSRSGDCLNIKMRPGEIKEVIWVNERHLSNKLQSILSENKDALCISVGDQIYTGNDCRKWLNENAGLVMEDPWQEMIFPEMSVLNNIIISVLRKFPNYYVLKRYEKGIMKMLDGILDEKYFSMQVQQMEPYMRQKIVYCRLLVSKPKLVVCIKPLSEGNIHVRKVTKEMIEMLAENGAAVLCMTTDVQERTFKDGMEIYVHGDQIISMEKAWKLTNDL